MTGSAFGEDAAPRLDRQARGSCRYDARSTAAAAVRAAGRPNVTGGIRDLAGGAGPGIRE